MSQPKVGDIYRRENGPQGKLYRVISICEHPSMTLEEVGHQPPPQSSFPERISGAIGSKVFDGLVKLVPEQ